MKKVTLLGSTGSIGVNTLEIIKNLKDRFCIKYLSGHRNGELLLKQAEIYNPEYVIITHEKTWMEFKDRFRSKVLFGSKYLKSAAEDSDVEIVVNALVGCAGLEATIAAVEAGKHLALANKESLVMAGELVNKLKIESGAKIYPVDSEHSAIFQALNGEDAKSARKIYLTASGGPFRTFKGDLSKVTVKEALNHPKWSMGSKITIDSATLMNKGLEMIEAVHLFDFAPDKIQVVVHPESIVHSMVEYADNSIIAQLGLPDMKIPIQYALIYPERFPIPMEKFDIFKVASLNFEKPDFVRFPALRLAYEAIEKGDTYPVVLNAVNEVMVYKFLKGQIKFTEISESVEKALENHSPIKDATVSEILELNNEMFKLYD